MTLTELVLRNRAPDREHDALRIGGQGASRTIFDARPPMSAERYRVDRVLRVNLPSGRCGDHE